MENRPKRSLSLKKQGQKKLNFAPKVQGQGADLSSAPPVVPEEDIPTALPAASSSPSSSWLSGLCNLGNTCYANSILQVLRFCPHFSTKVTILSDILLHQQRGKANGKELSCWLDSLSRGGLFSFSRPCVALYEIII